jgi:AraC-like DNA-binding protein
MFSRQMRRFPFEPFATDQHADPKRRYHLELDRRFPFAIRLISYDDITPPFPLSWHERLELFVPCNGHGEFLMGETRVAFSPGDVVVVDNMKLHGIVKHHGTARRAMVITFMPEFVYNLASPACDSLFLTPFYWQPAGVVPAIRATDPAAAPLHKALMQLTDCYYARGGGLHFQAGCKAFLLEALYLLADHFGWPDHTQQEYVQQQERSRLLGNLHEFLLANVSEKITVGIAASLVNMSESTFMKYFKRVTGETFVSYLTRLRLERAADLLAGTNMAIAEISYTVGFPDQSYFDRVFRRHFSKTPREVRKGPMRAAIESGSSRQQPAG